MLDDDWIKASNVDREFLWGVRGVGLDLALTAGDDDRATYRWR